MEHMQNTKNMDARFSSIDISSNLPKWLEDMSNNIKRSKSESEYKNPEMNNNEASNPKIAEEYFDFLLKTPASVELSSARHGRRANFPDKKSPMSTVALANEIKGIVPKINNLQLNSIAFDKNNDISKGLNKLEPSEDIERYTPSLLEKENRSQSRLDDTTFFNDLISAITESYKPKNYSKNDSIPENISETSKIVTKNIEKEHKKPRKVTIDSKTNDSFKFLNKLPANPEKTMLLFDETYMSKLQKYNSRKHISTPNKRSRYKKYKFKQNLSKKESKQVDLSKILSRESVEKKIIVSEEVFIIPELPSGSKMLINILSTWGDKYYVGLNGVEIFESDGKPIEIKTINAPDVNMLPECVNDPRIVSNIFDGINRTHDDCHLWLAPFYSGRNHYINIEFEKHSEIAMMRIWNYNKSRIHSFRGARYIVITLDDVPIFKGEITQACGSVSGSLETLGDTILFTTDEEILENVSKNDEAFKTLISNSENENLEKNQERPITAAETNDEQRPLTFAKKYCSEENNKFIGTNKIDIVLMSNWGRSDFIGLTGIEIIGESEIKLFERNISCSMKGNLLPLLDGENLTNDENNMWSVLYNSSKHVNLTIKFDSYSYISGVRLWNYNENIEKSFGGVRLLKIFIDNKLLPNPYSKDSTFMLRRAPGNTNYDFVQEISFICQPDIKTTEAIYDFNQISQFREETFEQPTMPVGFVIQIVIYTTWGDQYYVGLNGIELYDQLGRMILLSENNICAYPESVNVLPGISGDIRTPEKLIDNINDNIDGTHSWLAPVVPKCLNRIYIVFDQPVTISVVKFWNYIKTPNRGVREFGILFDDLLVYNGILDKANDGSSIKYQSILFTNNTDVIKKEMATLVKHSIDSQGTILTNDKLRMTTGGSLPNVDQSLRPFTSVNHYRERTSQSN